MFIVISYYRNCAEHDERRTKINDSELQKWRAEGGTYLSGAWKIIEMNIFSSMLTHSFIASILMNIFLRAFGSPRGEMVSLDAERKKHEAK